MVAVEPLAKSSSAPKAVPRKESRKSSPKNPTAATDTFELSPATDAVSGTSPANPTIDITKSNNSKNKNESKNFRLDKQSKNW